MQGVFRRSSPSILRGGLLLLVGATATAGSFAAVGLADEFVGVGLAIAALDVFPPIVFEFGILWFGSLAMPLLVATTTLVAVCVFAATAEIVRRLLADRSSAVSGFAAFLGLAGVAVTISGSVVSALGAGATGAIAFVVLEIDLSDDVSDVRRRVLRTTGILAGTLGLGGLLAVRRDAPAATVHGTDSGDGLDDDRIPELLELADDRAFDLPNVEPLVSRDFYKVDITVVSLPSVDRDDWSLRIHGDVDRDLDLMYGDLTTRPTEHRFITLRCVSDYPNGELMDTALWTGTPLGPILNAAGAGENCCVRLVAEDDYYQAFPREVLETGFLAWGMNGEPLPRRHGAPLRVLIPGHWGEINVKWLSEIEIRDEPATGYWEERGWQGTGPVNTVAKFRSRSRDGDRVTIGGHAYAGVRGISRVEVSNDGGRSWEDARLSDPLPAATPVGGTVDSDGRAKDAWRMWKHTYERPDRHEVVVRAYERDGTLQPREETDPHPSGSTGWVSHTMHGNDE